MINGFNSFSSVPEIKKALDAIFQDNHDRHSIPPVFITLPGSLQLEYFMNGLCDELEESGCINFTGDRRWLNFRLEYPEESDFKSFSSMLQCLHRHSGYRNHFAGVVRIDLSDWIDHENDAKLSAILAYIHDYSDSIFFIISVTIDEPQLADGLKKETNRWMNTVMTDASCPSVESLTQLVSDKLTSHGHQLTTDARDLLKDSITALSSQTHFAGVRQIVSLSDAILMEIGDVKEISANQLSPFGPDGDWIAACMDSEEITIGFTGGTKNGRK